ncbi:E3 ubiquitin-protein ligase PUB23-like [Mangifera indica]|uniref:E3 ubiquitin-protein ligase PUB23-like n=1 Tax=Mangifera indica TaxID=29780 RepID=UPI001CF939A6|nr:E3 ubiquitin-protein ligase PUB23-like [Mangifera indica]
MEEIDVPHYFLCPISLEIMKDPVTVSTGITYDRQSIEKWLFSGKNNTCPMTKQVLSPDCELTPNHTLRRLIQSWCTLNASYGIERIPTPKPPINKAQISKLIRDAKSSPQLLVKCLRRLRSIAAENETNKRCLEVAGAVDFLASILSRNSCFVSFEESTEEGFDFRQLSEEALGILCNLQLSNVGLKNLMNKNGDFVESLTQIMKLGTFESRAYAVVLLKSMLEVEVADPIQFINLSPQFFIEIIQILHDQISHQASIAALQNLVHILPWGRNRVKAVEASAVSILIDLLLEKSDRRDCELILMTIDFLCQCAEGRAELLKHGAGMAIVSKKILRVSQMASDRAVRILLSISKFSATPSVLQEMLQLGVVAKLCLVLQVKCSNNTKDKAREILKMHARAWKNSPCVPSTLIGSYPVV